MSSFSTSFSFERLEYRFTEQEFWTSLGNALPATLPLPRPIQSRQDFFATFAAHAWQRGIVLLVDELSELFRAKPAIRDDFLRALREVRNNNTFYAIRSVIAAGTFSILHLNPTNYSVSPFNVADHVFNPNFTMEETLTLFQEFARDKKLIFEEDVIRDVWFQSNGCVFRLVPVLQSSIFA
jgi:hypothetical protein